MNPNANYQTLSRRDFLSLIAKLSVGTALVPSLVACSVASGYEEQEKLTWERPFQKENSMESKFREILRYAILAPSGHNTQPWMFSIEDEMIRITPDYSRRLAVVDPDDRELFISLGCALENLVISARQTGYEVEPEYFPSTEPDSIVVRMRMTTAMPDNVLFDAIPQRQSTRNEYNKQSVPSDELKKLEESAKPNGLSARTFVDTKEIEQLIEFVKAGDKHQLSDKAFVDELIEWIRFNDDELFKNRDGLSTRCTGNPSVPRWLGSLFLRSSPDAQTDTDVKNIRSSAGMVLFVSDRNDKSAWIETGRVYERFALTATLLNIKTAFMNQPIEVPEFRSQLQSSLNLGNAYPQLLFRFGYSQTMPRSLRRPLEQVLA
jgi:hypothetical protein